MVTLRYRTVAPLVAVVVAMLPAQEMATLDSGGRVVLYEDGTWEHVSDASVREETIGAELVSFRYVESNSSNDWANDYRDFFDIGMRFSNTTQRDMRAFRAVVVFEDLFGDVVWRVNLRQNNPIASDSTTEWNGIVTYDRFDDSHAIIRGMRVRDMTISLADLEIVWSE